MIIRTICERGRALGIAIGMALLILSLAGGAGALSNSGGGSWQYYRDITINNPGGALSDYQILLNLSGAAFPAHANASGADIRFEQGGAELSYWFEKWDYANASALVWVNVTSIPASGSAVVRMWWENPSAAGVSDGTKTFEFFDDFDGASLDMNKWDIVGSPSVSNSTVVITGSNFETMKSKKNLSKPLVFEYYAKIIQASGSYDMFGFWNGPESVYVHSAYGYFVGNPGSGGPPGFIAIPRSYSIDVYRLWKIIWTENDVKFYADNKFDKSTTLFIPKNSTKALAGIQLDSSAIYIDSIKVRKFSSPEPTVSGFGPVNPVPEIPTYAMVLIGALALVWMRRWKKG